MIDPRLADAWSGSGTVAYYGSQRNALDSLYDSERRLLTDVLTSADSVLDVGCAAGGFARIATSYNPNIRYTGVDISPAMIFKAKSSHPEATFEVIQNNNLPFEDNAFGATIILGVLHLNEDWQALLQEAWRVCRTYVVFDLRMVPENGINDRVISYQKIALDGDWDGVSVVPYVLVDADGVSNAITSLVPEVIELKAHGYWCPISETAESVYAEACMTVFSLRKQQKQQVQSDWEVPIPTPSALAAKYFKPPQ